MTPPLPEPTGTVVLPGGREIAYDDVGDPAGAPLVYLHGCRDCRLARHPDDGVAARLGVRLVAVDRPGYARSAPDPAGTEVTQADDVAALMDSLGIGRFGVLGWSAGGPGALALAAKHGDRVAVAAVAAGTVPVASEPNPATFAAEAAPMVAQPGIDPDDALEAVLEGADEPYRRDLAAVDGLHGLLALSLAAAVAPGLDGVERDLRAAVSPWPFDPAAIGVPVVLWYGTADRRVAVSAGESLAGSIPDVRLHVVEGASHLLPLVHWERLLVELAAYLP